MDARRLAVLASALSNDVRTVPRRARAAGFAGLVFDAYSPALNIPELSASGRREFGHMLSTEQQQLVALRCDLGVKGFGSGADVDQVLTRLDRALEAAATLGAGCVCVDLGPLPPAPVAERPKPTVTPEQAGLIILPTFSKPAEPQSSQPAPAPADPALVSQVNAAMAELCSRADRYRMTVALSSSLADFAALDRVLGDARCPWFGVDLDPVAILRDAWDADDVFSSLGPHVRHVRARDAALGADRRTRPAVIGQGSVDWPQFISSLDAAGYRGMITIDPTELADRYAAAVAGREYLEKL